MKRYILTRSRGDTIPIDATLKLNNVAVDLSGATVKLYAIDSQYWRGVDFDAPYSDDNLTGDSTTANSGLLAVSAGTCTLPNGGSDGLVRYTPSATTLATGGDYVLQYKVTYADGTVEMVPPIDPARAQTLLLVRVGASLAALA